uniref:Uncharacterized protein n=1 Tax=Anguilla anguilla TaxID=7936 RepID=A0A0E9UJB1_ANGAN
MGSVKRRFETTEVQFSGFTMLYKLEPETAQ